MNIVCFYLKRDLHRNVLNTKPFCRDIHGLRYWKNNCDILSIFSVFFIFSNLKVRKNLNGVNFGNLFGSLVTLLPKWPGISKICPPFLNYKMLFVLSNTRLVFDSSQGTPCIIFVIPKHATNDMQKIFLIQTTERNKCLMSHRYRRYKCEEIALWVGGVGGDLILK